MLRQLKLKMVLKAKFILIILTLLMITPVFSNSQEINNRMGDRMDDEELPVDVKEKKIVPKIGQWYVSGFGAFQDSTTLDTLIDNFQIYNPVFRNSITSSYVGNYGTPALNNDSFNRNSNVDFLFLKSVS